MNDRELLELAAKAADWTEARWFKGALLVPHPTENRRISWKPLTDDGDALRLAVRLGEKYPAAVVGIFNRDAFPHTSASVVHRDGSETHVEQDAGDDDLASATRRAIVRVAAAIGSAS